MKWDAPEILLGLFILGSGCCLIGGTLLARDEVLIREGRSQEPHETFIKQLDVEIDRLTALYESHLSRLAALPYPSQRSQIQSTGATIRGVRQYSLLVPSVTSRANVHLPLRKSATDQPLPAPTFDLESVAGGRPGILLDPERFLSDQALFQGDDEGWIDEPGKPLLFWKRHQDRRLAILLIDVHEVRQAVNDGLQDWLPASFGPLAVQAGQDRLESPGGETLIGSNVREQPHFLLTLPTLFGTWRLASWDPVRVEPIFRWPIALVGISLALILLLLGGLAYLHQRRAVKLAQSRVSFVNQVSHELRSPLTNILLNVELATEAAEEAPGTVKRLQVIGEESRRLGRLVGNVLTYSQQEEDNMALNRQTVCVDDAVHEVLETFKNALQRAGIKVRLELGDNAPIKTDRDALVQVLGNLVSNVEKYAAQGGLLKVSTSIQNDMFRIRVADRGPGIRLRDRDRIFQAFVRANHRLDEGTSGTGLGLAIARGLAEDLGGELALIESFQGACFELTLPLAA